MLLLIELAALGDGGEHAGLVDVHADLEQAVGVVPVDELGADDAGVRPERLLDEGADGVGLEGDVVVAAARRTTAPSTDARTWFVAAP